ncbi:VWA-like domain-containing protein [Desulfobacterales bacterium HSG16]|nr:VWA-like domain-containing protein [Desulfobacterales bacterium HSG16]
MALKSARDRIGMAVERWFITDPLFFSIWTTHNLIVEPRIQTIRSGRGRIEYNPLFIQSLNKHRLDTVLRCEAMRILLKHPYTRRKENQKLAWLASNVTIQEYLRTDLPFPFARDLFGTDEFDRQYFEFYYYKLQTQTGQADGQFDGQTNQKDGQTKTDDGKDSDNESKAGKSEPDEEKKESTDQPEGNKYSLEIYADAEKIGKENTLDWDRDELITDNINEKIEMARDTNQWGTIPGQIQERILATLKPKVDYRAILRHFRASILSANRVLTRMKPSRRYGFQYMGSRRDFATRLLFAVDVSGSVDSKDLARGFSVINQFFKYGLQCVDVIQFDTEIKGEAMSLKKARRDISVLGRGGTDFTAVIEYIDENREYDGLIVFTDGFAPVPRKPANRKTRVLWLFNTESNWEDMHLNLKSIGRSAFLKED